MFLEKIYVGEILDKEFVVYYREDLTTSSRQAITFNEGDSLQDVVDSIGGHSVNVLLNGELILPEEYSSIYPSHDDNVVVIRVPKKNALPQLLMMAVAVVAVVASGPIAGMLFPTLTGTSLAIATGVVGMAISIAGSLLINALFPPALPKLNPISENVKSISNVSNKFDPWGAVPVILGKHRIFPKKAAAGKTAFDNNDQYLTEAFLVGYSGIDISDIRLGNTPINEFEDLTTAYVSRTTGNAPLYLNTASELAVGVDISVVDNVWVVRTTSLNTSTISVDIEAPRGSYSIDGRGRRSPWNSTVQIQYSLTGQNNWMSLGTVSLASNNTEARRITKEVTVTSGQYDVRVRRTGTRPANGIDDIFWTRLRSYTAAPIVSMLNPVQIYTLKIRASEQLNGTISTLNMLAQSRCKSWNGTTWVNNVNTSNPGDLYRYVLQHPANAKPKTDSEIDLTAIQAFASFCTEKGYECNLYIEDITSVWEVIRTVLAAGRATPAFVNNKWSVIWDDNTIPVTQHFTPANSRNFKAVRTYTQVSHGFRVQFLNEEKDYVQDEMVVYFDGFSASNATKFETIEFPGITKPSLIWKFARYYMAEVALRRETFTIDVDWEFLSSSRGDKVSVAHDVPGIGFGFGRIISQTGTAIKLDTEYTLSAGTNYYLTIRRETGEVSTHIVTVPSSGVHTTVNTSTALSPVLDYGVVYSIGVINTDKQIMRIKTIAPNSDFTATLTLVEDAPGIYTADTGTIPPYNSVVALPRDPYQHTFSGLFLVQEPITINGVTRSRVTLYFSPPAALIDYVEVQINRDNTYWQRYAKLNGDTRSVEINDISSGTYSFRVRGNISAKDQNINPGLTQWAMLANQVITSVTTFPSPTITGVTPLSHRSLRIMWDYDSPLVKHFEINAGNTNVFAASTLIGTTTTTNFVESNLSASTTRYYWVRAIMSSEVANANSPWSAVASGTTPLISAIDIENGIINTAKFAQGIEPVTIVASGPVPTVKSTEVIYHAPTNKIYRWNGTAYTAVVATTDLTGTISSEQIADAAISLAKFASGTRPIEVVSSLPTTGNTAGRTVFLTTDNKLYRHTGSPAGSAGFTAVVPAADISGQLTDAQIAALAASKITGQLTDAQIQAIAAAKLTGQISTVQIADGAITNAKIVGLAASKITGQLTDAQIEAIAAAKLTGQISTVQIANNAITDAKIAGLAASKITGQLTDAQIQAIAAAKLTGQISTVQIADDAITAAKVATNAITALKISDGAITETKIASNAVTNAKIANNAVNASKIADAAITAAKIGAEAVNATKLATGAVTAEKVAAGAITAGKIAAGAVTASEIAAGAITAGKIAANAVTANEIAAGAIAADKIAAGAITASKLLLSDMTNFAGHQDMTDEAFWSLPTGVSFVDGNASWQSARLMRLQGAPNAYVVSVGRTFLVEPGQNLYISYNAQITAGNGRVMLDVQFSGSPSFTLPLHASVGFTTSTSITTIEGTLAVPVGVSYARVRIYKVNDGATECYVGKVVCRIAANAKLIVDGSINSDKIQANAVTASKITANAIDASKIAAGAVTADKVAANAIDVNKLAANAVTAAKISAGAVTTDKIAAGAVTANEVAAEAITSAKIAAGAVVAGKIAANAITSTEITAGAITAAKIATNAVDADKITANAITSAKIAAGAITTAKIAAGAVTADKIAANAITAAKISAGAVEAAKIAAGAVVADKIAAGAITSDKISANAVTADKIDANAVTAVKIDAGAITTAKIAAGAVTAETIAANAITAAKISAGAVEAAKIAAGAISADKIAANAVIADKIAANAITTAKIAADAVTAGKIAAGAVTANEIAANAVTADKIAANAVTASRMVVSDLANLWHDYDHIDDNAMIPSSDWSYAASSTPQRGIRQINISASGAAQSAYSPWRTIEPSTDYFAEASCGCVDGTATTYIQLGIRDSTGAVTFSRQVTVLSRVNASSVRSGTTFQTNDDERVFRIRYYRPGGGTAQAVYGGFMLRRRANGSLIVDGAITADKIAANAITADKIAANSIVAGKIAAGAISASEIAANAIIGEKIAAGAVTAAKISVSSLDAISANLGSIVVGNANIANASITTLKLGTGAVETPKLSDFATVDTPSVLLGSGSFTNTYTTLGEIDINGFAPGLIDWVFRIVRTGTAHDIDYRVEVIDLSTSTTRLDAAGIIPTAESFDISRMFCIVSSSASSRVRFRARTTSGTQSYSSVRTQLRVYKK